MKTSKKAANVVLKTYNIYVFCENKRGEKEKVTLRLTGDGIIDVMLQAEKLMEDNGLCPVSGYRYDLLQVWNFN